MEAPPAHGCRGQVPWKVLLLAVSHCIFWVPPTHGRLVIESRHQESFRTPTVTLQIDELPSQVERYVWFKGDPVNVNNEIASYNPRTGKMTLGPAYKGQKILHPGVTLKILNVTMADTGYYTVEAIKTNKEKVKVSTHLFVLEQLNINYAHESTSIVHENDDLGILCLNPKPNYSVHWMYNGHKLRRRDNSMLSKDLAMLSIDQVRKEDAGCYQCKYLHILDSKISETLRLEVV